MGSEVGTFLGHLLVGTLASEKLCIYVFVSGCPKLTNPVVILLKPQTINWPAEPVNRRFPDRAPLSTFDVSMRTLCLPSPIVHFVGVARVTGMDPAQAQAAGAAAIAALDDEALGVEELAHGQSIWAPQGVDPHSRIVRGSLFESLWTGFEVYFRQQLGINPGTTVLAQTFSQAPYSMSFESVQLLSLIWDFKLTQSGKRLNFQDIFFASFNSKFGAPTLDTHQKWASFPSNMLDPLRQLCIFDVDSLQNGIIARWRGAQLPNQRGVANVLARDAAMNAFWQFAKDQSAQLASSAPATLFASKSSGIERLIKTWERDHNDGVPLTPVQKGSEKLYKKLHAMFTNPTTLDYVPLTECNSQKSMDLEARSQISEPDAFKTETVLSGSVGGELSFKTKPGLFDGAVRITSSNYDELLGVWCYSHAVCQLAKVSRLLRLKTVITDFIEEYPQDQALVWHAAAKAQKTIIDGVSPTDSFDDRLLVYADPHHPFWEKELRIKARDAFSARVAAQLEASRQLALPRKPQPAGPGGPAAESAALKAPGAPKPGKLVDADFSPFKRGAGSRCSDFHAGKGCSKHAPNDPSHACPLLECRGAIHSFTLQHPYKTWSGHDMTPDQRAAKDAKRARLGTAPGGAAPVVTPAPPPAKPPGKGRGRGRG